MQNSIDILELKRRLPLPDLLRGLGLGKYCKTSCKSPLRADENPSWGIYPDGDCYRWKDHGNGDGGDEIEFLARYLHLETNKHFHLLLQIYEAMASTFKREAIGLEEPQEKGPPEMAGFGKGNPELLGQLSQVRGISSAALEWAQERGVLVFGTWQNIQVFGVKDQSGKLLNIRPLNGSPFPAYGAFLERKSHLVKGSNARWPVGIMEAQQTPFIVLVEGVPDFLAAHDFILKEGLVGKCSPVGMTSASVSITDEALSLFKGKTVAIYPHTDKSGIGMEAAQRWKIQLTPVAAQVYIFDTSRLSSLTQEAVKDLNDYLKWDKASFLAENPQYERIMPQ